MMAGIEGGSLPNNVSSYCPGGPASGSSITMSRLIAAPVGEGLDYFGRKQRLLAVMYGSVLSGSTPQKAARIHLDKDIFSLCKTREVFLASQFLRDRASSPPCDRRDHMTPGNKTDVTTHSETHQHLACTPKKQDLLLTRQQQSNGADGTSSSSSVSRKRTRPPPVAASMGPYSTRTKSGILSGYRNSLRCFEKANQEKRNGHHAPSSPSPAASTTSLKKKSHFHCDALRLSGDHQHLPAPRRILSHLKQHSVEMAREKKEEWMKKGKRRRDSSSAVLSSPDKEEKSMRKKELPTGVYFHQQKYVANWVDGETRKQVKVSFHVDKWGGSQARELALLARQHRCVDVDEVVKLVSSNSTVTLLDTPSIPSSSSTKEEPPPASRDFQDSDKTSKMRPSSLSSSTSEKGVGGVDTTGVNVVSAYDKKDATLPLEGTSCTDMNQTEDYDARLSTRPASMSSENSIDNFSSLKEAEGSCSVENIQDGSRSSLDVHSSSSVSTSDPCRTPGIGLDHAKEEQEKSGLSSSASITFSPSFSATVNEDMKCLSKSNLMATIEEDESATSYRKQEKNGGQMAGI
ncbi:ap2 domain transcription factor ap2xii-6 [Cystoisospora suis]|uniref:Ap2 domain transcription factor ap2xii-6 n=1 Tax=Cystoisospora suis TaxID=483139 RepID=A0A2C6KSF6_9APIC|nr:ap2 domain transcription factor ap2xii-6 [Cystoisospora suis]